MIRRFLPTTLKLRRINPPKHEVRRRIISLVACAALLGSVPLCGIALAQGSRKDDIVLNARGQPLAGATIRVCTAAATGQPCTPLASIFSDQALTQALVNPTTTDGLGNYSFYAAPGRYMIEISGTGITTKQIPNVLLPNDPSSPTFSSITTTSGISAFSLTLSGNLTVSGSAAVTGSLTVGGAAVPSTGLANAWTGDQFFASGRPVYDVMGKGASGSGQTTTGTMSASATALILAAAQDFKNGQGIAVFAAGANPTVLAPTACSAAPQGTAGTTTYTYQVTSIDVQGGMSAPTAAFSTTTGNATLSATNFNKIACTAPAVAGSMYGIYGRSGALVAIGVARVQTDGTTTLTWNDYGGTPFVLAYMPSAVPAAATPQILTTTISSGAGTTSLVLAAAATNAVTGVTVQHDDTVAIQAAVDAATNGGGTVYLPLGTFRFRQLDLSKLGQDAGNLTGWVVLKFDGTLSPLQPIILNRGLHALVGGGTQAPANLNFNRAPYSMINFTGTNPVVRVTTVSANPVYLEKIGINLAIGDGILWDSGATDLTMRDIAVTSGYGGGSPLRLQQATGGFGVYCTNCTFNAVSTTSAPAIYATSAGQLYFNGLFLASRGIKFDGAAGAPGTIIGISSFDTVLTENMNDTDIFTIDATGGTFTELSIRNMEVADNIASPVYLFKGLGGIIQDISVVESRGWNNLAMIDPASIAITGLFIKTQNVGTGVGGPAGTAFFMQQPGGNFVTNAASNAIGATTGLTNIPLLIQPTNSAAPALVVKALAGQTNNLHEWQDSTGLVRASMDPVGKLTTDTEIVGKWNNVRIVGPAGSKFTTIQGAYNDCPTTGTCFIWDRRDGQTITDTISLGATPKQLLFWAAHATYAPTGGQLVSIPGGFATPIALICPQGLPEYATVTGQGCVIQDQTNGVAGIAIANAVSIRIEGFSFEGGTTTGAHISIAGGATPLAAAQIFIERNGFQGKDNAISATGVTFQIHVEKNNINATNSHGIAINNNGGAASVSWFLRQNWFRTTGGSCLSVLGAGGISNLVVEESQCSNITAANTAGFNITLASGVTLRDNDFESITGTGTSNCVFLSGAGYLLLGGQMFDCRGTGGAIAGNTLSQSVLWPARVVKGSSLATVAITLQDAASTKNFIGNFQTDFAGEFSDGSTGGTNVKFDAVNNTFYVPGAFLSNGVSKDGSGFKHIRVASCTTAAAAGSTCATTITWTTALADANYTAVCTIDAPTGVPYVLNTSSKLGASLVATIANLTAVAAGGTLDCVAVHD